jgi:hypothetical protein
MKNTVNTNTTNSLTTLRVPKLVNKEQLNIIITNKGGSPDYLAINLYYDTLRSWYNPKIGYRKDGNIYHINKLKTPGVYLDYKRLAEIHGCSKETIRQKIVKLEELGLVHRSFQHRETVTTKSYNQLIAYVWKDTPHFYNPMGVDSDQVPILRPQTNHEYIAKKYGIYFAALAPSNKGIGDGFDGGGGIQAWLDTKELNNISEDIRSNAQAHGSNFYNNFDSSIQTESVELVEEQKERLAEERIVGDNAPTEETKVKNRRVKKRKANQRKKPTNSSMKAKIIKLVSYSKPKSLGEMHSLLDQGMYDELRSKSGREFSNNFIAQKVLAMSKNPAITASFRYKAGFISYMSLALRHELHDTVKTSGEGFRLRSNMTEEDKQDAAAEKFLTDIEQEAIRRVCPENQLKAKLANALEKTKAYQLLSSFIKFKVSGGTVQIHLNRILSLTEHEKALILAQVQATYERADFRGAYQFIENLEFVVEKPAYDWHIAKANNANTNCRKENEPLKLPEGVWGEVLEKLIVEYGVDTYKHWFSKLTAEVDEVAKTIELKASSSMVEDRIISNYARSITQIASGIGFELKGVI